MKSPGSKSRQIVRVGLCAAVVVSAAALVAAWFVPLPARLAEAPSTVVRFSDRSMGFVFLSADEKWRIHATQREIDSDYVDALISYEDRRFWLHPGVDPVALTRALFQNLVSGSVVSGASTLTMQLVRVLEPRPRSVWSKIVEAARALQLEIRLGKRGILSAYMTFISFGKNIEGVETAAWAYFGHGAGNLTPAEIAVLLAVPQLPAKRYPSEDHEMPLRTARDKILRQLYARKAVDPKAEALPASLAAPVPLRLRPFPREAAHLAFWLQQSGGVNPDAAGDIMTTIDPAAQKLASHLSDREGRVAADQGVHHHAVVVVDHESSEIKALVGGMNFWNRRAGSQIVGFQIPRSPGSLLKPFIYANAIDRGLVIPDRLVTDIPKDYGGYAPRNYDGNFSGLVRIEDALARSLNVPFVNLLEAIGIENFLGMIGQAGITRILKSPGFYGLSVAAGGIELSALEVAGLYASLARDGMFRPLRWLRDSTVPASEGLPLFSSGAAWMTRKALRMRDRPDFPRRRDFAKAPAGVFWKTGTSFGHRDAWAAGSAGRFTAVVWYGNVDYAPSHALVGADMAAPLLFDILENLAEPMQIGEDTAPPAVGMSEVCSLSGYLAGPACQHRRHVHTLTQVVPGEVCPFHTEMEIETKSGLAVGPTCRAGRTTERRRFMNWPAGVRRYLSSANRHLPDLPSIHPACIHIAADDALRIVSPARNKTMIIIPGLDAAKQEIPFEVDSGHASEMVSWFLDGTFVRTARADQQVWWKPQPGAHEVTVVGASGRSASQKFQVKAF
jgi:penicillin-binding protein 1C